MIRMLPRLRLPAGPFGLLLAGIALVMQLAAASVVPQSGAAAAVERLVAASICHHDDLDNHGTPAPHHAPDCAVCPVCQAIAHTPVLLTAPVAMLAAPVLLIARVFALPAVRAPPGWAPLAGSARGPPAPL